MPTDPTATRFGASGVTKKKKRRAKITSRPAKGANPVILDATARLRAAIGQRARERRMDAIQRPTEELRNVATAPTTQPVPTTQAVPPASQPAGLPVLDPTQFGTLQPQGLPQLDPTQFSSFQGGGTETQDFIQQATSDLISALREETKDKDLGEPLITRIFKNAEEMGVDVTRADLAPFMRLLTRDFVNHQAEEFNAGRGKVQTLTRGLGVLRQLDREAFDREMTERRVAANEQFAKAQTLSALRPRGSSSAAGNQNTIVALLKKYIGVNFTPSDFTTWLTGPEPTNPEEKGLWDFVNNSVKSDPDLGRALSKSGFLSFAESKSSVRAEDLVDEDAKAELIGSAITSVDIETRNKTFPDEETRSFWRANRLLEERTRLTENFGISPELFEQVRQGTRRRR